MLVSDKYVNVYHMLEIFFLLIFLLIESKIYFTFQEISNKYKSNKPCSLSNGLQPPHLMGHQNSINPGNK